MQGSRCNNVLPRVKKNPRRETLLKGVDAVIAAVSSTSVGLPDVEIGHVGGVINPEGPLGLALGERLLVLTERQESHAPIMRNGLPDAIRASAFLAFDAFGLPGRGRLMS